MANAQEVVPGFYQLPLGIVNAYLVASDTLTLIDTGTPGSEEKILSMIRGLGRSPEEVTAIIVTHCHADHTGSLAALKEATGAAVWMHPLDAALVQGGRAMREVQPAPGVMNRVFYTAMRFMSSPEITPAPIEHLVHDGDELPLAGGLQVLHVPGHCAGQIALVWPHYGGVLIAADSAANEAFPWQRGLSYPPIFENMAEGERSLKRLGQLGVEVAVFGHGKPLVGEAGERFKERFGSQARVA